LDSTNSVIFMHENENTNEYYERQFVYAKNNEEDNNYDDCRN